MQLGWLASVPETKDAKGKVTRWTESRAARIKAQGQALPLVPVKHGEYLLTHLQAAGPSTRDGAGGEVKLSWQEISAYCAATGALPHAWERRALRSLSEAYLIGKAEGKSSPLAKPFTERDDF